MHHHNTMAFQCGKVVLSCAVLHNIRKEMQLPDVPGDDPSDAEEEAEEEEAPGSEVAEPAVRNAHRRGGRQGARRPTGQEARRGIIRLF